MNLKYMDLMHMKSQIPLYRKMRMVFWLFGYLLLCHSRLHAAGLNILVDFGRSGTSLLSLIIHPVSQKCKHTGNRRLFFLPNVLH